MGRRGVEGAMRDEAKLVSTEDSNNSNKKSFCSKARAILKGQNKLVSRTKPLPTHPFV